MSKNHLTIVWSAKGGTGVTTTTALIALRTTRQSVVASFDTDLACVLGQTADTPNGLSNWVNNSRIHHANRDAQPLSSCGIGVSNWVRFVPPGNQTQEGTMPDAGTIIARLTDCGSDVILDCGGLPLGTIKQLAAVADQSLLVVRACYLTLRRCTGTGIPTTGIVLVKEQGRALRTCDVEAALGRAVLAEIPICPSISRASDAGLFQTLHARYLPSLDLIGTDFGVPIG